MVLDGVDVKLGGRLMVSVAVDGVDDDEDELLSPEEEPPPKKPPNAMLSMC